MKVNPRNVAGFLRRAFSLKKKGMWERSAASHRNLQSHRKQDVLYFRKHTESDRVSATCVLVEKNTESGQGWQHHM